MKKFKLILLFTFFSFFVYSQDVLEFKKEIYSIDSLIHYGKIKELKEAKKNKVYKSLFILRAGKSIDYMVIIVHDRKLVEWLSFWINKDELISLRGLDETDRLEIYYRKY